MRGRRLKVLTALWVGVAVCVTGGASALELQPIAIDLLDDFNDAQSNGWGGAQGATRILLGGPDGAADPYFDVTSTGTGSSGSRMVAIASTSWLGDYRANGIARIGADLNNFGSTELMMRLQLQGGGGLFFSATPIVLDPASGWQRIEFDLTDFVQDVGDGLVVDLDFALSFVSDLRIVHAVGTSFPPDRVAGHLGIDNVGVIAIPEPTGLFLLGVGGLSGVLLGRRRVV